MESTSIAFGADVTAKQAVGLCIALCLGTTVEWYDFTIYSQLSSTLTQVFFPRDNPATAALASWGVYAVGFISRPVGAVVFGHIGDTIGRRLSLLLSVLLITLPTAVIGALPTYDHAGIVAPTVLALLRFIQGVAVGGEFGSAVVYLYEMAPKHRRGFVASLGQQAIGPGIILGIGACLAVLYGCTPDQLLVWGWRVPFLVTILTAPIALVLRMHMPEPREFLHSKQEMVLQRVVDTAAAKVAKSFVQKHSDSDTIAPRMTSRQVSMRLHSLTKIVVDADQPAESVDQAKMQFDAGSAGKQGSKPNPSTEQTAEHLSVKVMTTCAAANHTDGSYCCKAVPGRDTSATCAVQLQPICSQLGSLHGYEGHELGCEREYAAEVQELSSRIKHHLPALVLFKHHWKGLWLQFFVSAVMGSTANIFFSWAPPYLHSTTGVSTQMTLWAVMIGMGVFMLTVPATGYLMDKGIPKVWCYMALTLLCAACSIPVMNALYTGSLVALFVLLPLMLGLEGCMSSLLTSIGPQIYPSGVRTSGYNLGHNLAMSIWGGLSPLLISALALVMNSAALAAGVLIVALALVSFVAAILLIHVAPDTNAGDCCSCFRGKSVKGKADGDLKYGDQDTRSSNVDLA